MSAPVVRRRVAARLVLAALACACAAPASADPDAARAALAAANAALERREWKAAREQFERAIAEEPALDEARVGLAEALLGGNDRAGALDVLRRLAAGYDGGPAPTGARLTTFQRVRKRLNELDPDFAALDGIVRKHADDLVAIAARWAQRDPAGAERALQAALVLVPDHPKAADALTGARKSSGGRKITLFDGRGFTGWTWASQPVWRVVDGTIAAECTDGAMILRSNEKLSGNFDVLVEAKLVEEFPKLGPTHFGVIAPWVSKEKRLGTSFGFVRGKLFAFDGTGPTDADEKQLVEKDYAEVGKGLGATEWHVYELRFRPDEVIVALDGETLATTPRAPDRDNGYVLLKIQFAKAIFRRVDVIKR